MKTLSNISVLLILFIGFNTSKVNAQVDTAFWFAAPWVTPDHDQNFPMAFHFSTENNPTTIRLRQPASVYDTTFIVPANSLFSKYVAHIVDSLESKPADALLNCGFYITSDFPIVTVYDFISEGPASNNPETYSLKGQNGLGYEFVTPFQTLWNNRNLGSDRNGDGVVTQPKQMFCVVASEDNTTIYITPRCPVVGGHPANVTYSVFLPFAGNVYTCENLVQTTSSVPGSSLAGSIVVSDKKIAVTISDDSVNPSGGGGCYDLMGDQIVPIDVIGLDYIVNKGFLNAGSNESVFIVATENFTSVSINNGLTITNAILNQGDTYQYSITEQLTYVQADKNVYVLHQSGYGCEMGQAILPPLNCAGSDQVSFPRTNAFSFLLNVLCPAGAEGNFTVNGDPTIVQAIDFAAVPGTAGAWMGAQIDIPTSVIASGSSATIVNSSDLFSLGIINGGATGGCLYHYLSIFNRKVLVEAGNDTTLCNGSPQIDLIGSIEGGTTTGIWSILNGTGTLNTPNNLITSYLPTTSDYSQGNLTFVLESTGNCDPVFDTLKVSFIQSPVVGAGNDNSFCKNNVTSFPISGSVNFAAGASWTGGNMGAIANSGSLNTTYTPSPADIAADSVALFLTSAGSFFACPNDMDTVVVYFTEPPSVFAGPDQVICSSEDEVSLSGSVTGASSTGEWTSSGLGGFSPSNLTFATNYLVTPADTVAGTVRLILTSTNNGGCLAVSDSLEVTILEKPIITLMVDDSVCSNLPNFVLSGMVSPGFGSIWTSNGFGNVVTPGSQNTLYNISALDTAAGSVMIYLSTPGSICPIERDSIEVQFVNPPSVYAGLDQAFCDNASIQLNGSISGAGNSGSWTSTGTGLFNPSNNLLSTIYTPSAADFSSPGIQLYLESTNNFGCPADRDTLAVTFKPAPVANYNFNVACSGENTNFADMSTLTAGTIITWQWNFGDMTSSIADNPIHPYLGSGSYNATLIVEGSNGCTDTITQVVNVNPSPIAEFLNGEACLDQSMTFTDNSFISSGNIIAWDYNFGNGDFSNGVEDPTYIYGVTGSYQASLTVTSNLGCQTTYTNIVNVLPGPDAVFDMTPNPALALEDIIFTDQSTGNGIIDWFWNFGDSIGDNSQNTVHQYAGGGSYTVTLFIEDNFGCIDSTSQEILVALLPVVPTAFTPNGDNENDMFLIRGGPFVAVDFKVYSSWGDLIFQSNDANIGWDGTHRVNEAPLGVYTWTFEVEIPGGRIIRESGDVTLMR
ncbi:MAG: gliding motility-associated-like protein [Flavobacteriales bacterium]|jgi:gliding motility-associated-like protein